MGCDRKESLSILAALFIFLFGLQNFVSKHSAAFWLHNYCTAVQQILHPPVAIVSFVWAHQGLLSGQGLSAVSFDVPVPVFPMHTATSQDQAAQFWVAKKIEQTERRLLPKNLDVDTLLKVCCSAVLQHMHALRAVL